MSRLYLVADGETIARARRGGGAGHLGRLFRAEDFQALLRRHRAP